eukprot:jgi/Tetstr1/463095/TSEL_008029.t1
MGPALKPFGGAWSDAVRRDAQREEALHSKKLDASGADRRRAAKALRRQQVVDRLLQRLAQDRMKVEAERVANEAASEVMQDILDRMEEELRAESAPPPRSPLETCRQVLTRLAPELGVYDIEAISSRLVSKYGLGLDAEALQSCSESVLLHLAFGLQRAEVQAGKLSDLRRRTLVHAQAAKTSSARTTRFPGRRTVSLDDVATSQQPSAVDNLINNIDTGSFTTWPSPSGAMKNRKASSRRQTPGAGERQSTLLHPTKAFTMASMQAAEQRRRLEGSSKMHVQEEWRASAKSWRTARNSQSVPPDAAMNKAQQLPAISTGRRATAC